jgi:uncharacterized protein
MTFRFFLALLCVWGGVSGASLRAEEKIPPAPLQYVTDEAGVISPGVVADLNRQLATFEKETSNQVVAVVYPALPEGTSIEDYAQRLATAWHIGQKKTSNGVLLLLIIKNKKAWIQTGYGLEGALPDVTCHRIVREVMSPPFRKGNYDASLLGGIHAIMQATKGEYKGTDAKTHRTTLLDILFSPVGFFLFVMLIILITNRGRKGGGGGSGLGSAATGFFIGSSMGGGWGGGGSSGGSSDGGGFSGGGGDFGGGGGGGDL